MDLFLQLFDEGRLTDSLGRTVDGRHAVFIMTSNLMADRFQKNRKMLGFNKSDAYDVPDQDVENELMRHFRSEFINRIDETVLFMPLEEDVLLQIARQRFEELAESALQQGVILSGDEDALWTLVQRSINPALGARPLLRNVERAVARPLSKLILSAMSENSSETLRLRFVLVDGEPQLVDAQDASPTIKRRKPEES
jgi:ATP-dependent Clp protease ATP-binding subunit ClpB